MLEPKLTTNELARAAGVKPDSIRAAVCRSRMYFGIRPEKLVNGRLLWPADAPERLVRQG